MSVVFKYEDDKKIKNYIGDELYDHLRTVSHVCTPLKKNAYFVAFWWYNIKKLNQDAEQICIYCDDKEFIFFGNEDHFNAIVLSLPKDSTPYMALAEFFFKLTSGDVDELDIIEDQISELEEKLITTKKPEAETGSIIIELRHVLLKIKRYYDQLNLITDRLIENEVNIIPPDALIRFYAMDRRAERLSESVHLLREGVTQVREAYQAQIDIEQNQIMKLFTVFAAVFLPLTLIVGWYGMNFNIPAFNWTYGYLYVISISVVVCLISILIILKNRLF